MRNSLNWRNLKGLYKLYMEDSVTLKLMENAYIKNVLCHRKRLLDFKAGNKNIIVAKEGYKAYFKKELLPQYFYYKKFFDESELGASGLKQYDSYDIHTLMFIFNNREELRQNLTTARIFSSNVFKLKDSKYLENRPGLMSDVLFLLGVDDFPARSAKENQWRFVVDCPDPKYILLCENIDYLKAWWEFHANNIELWYAGGNNTPVIERISQRHLDLPLFYIGDWDYHGLDIYCRIQHILKEKGKNIQLITPDPNTAIYKPIKSGQHQSKWLQDEFSGLNRVVFSPSQIALIERLIAKNHWIEEQTIWPIPQIISHVSVPWKPT
ncbi:hypothetical protein IC229_19785 [Spirosoma sp. BT702]|uniref:Wadjet protein JetD C-terminal domain-containing protein n=1 Tax=Spirosoma profusum TaxID=2771354 RepID=A0A927ARV3_9BACT|nr:hypothetical protein [Spirosoma profusum]MBD2702898.1 hypothetical protein [Spirosoma profusum]